MKKLLLGLLFILLCITAQAEMVWVGLNPAPRSGHYADSATVDWTAPGNLSKGWSGNYSGFQITAKIVDSSGSATLDADSSCGIWYTYPINTEDVFAATGIFEIISITDSSTTEGHLFALGSTGAPSGTGSTYVWYTVKTGYIPYDPDAQVLVTGVEATTVSGTAIRVPITLTYEGDEGVDTLFKPWTWIEIALIDSTRWGKRISGPFDSTGTPVATASITVQGTYTASGELGRYHVLMIGCADDEPDSIRWTHYGDQGHVTSIDSAAVTASAQGLDSGITITFDAIGSGTDDDVFIFHVSDSLHYGKTVTYKMRAGLNLHRR